MSNWIRVLSLLMSVASGQAGTMREITPTVTMSPAIVIGFVGGFVRHDDSVHSEVQVAAHLRRDYSSDVYVETFENYHRGKARLKIIGLLDTNHDGTLTAEEKLKARIVIYGHSWGASAAIELARQLAGDGIPVLLTIQVDSVSKIGQNDRDIPANVAQAVNFYELEASYMAVVKFEPPTQHTLRSLGTSKATRKRIPCDVSSIPGGIVSSQSLTPKLSVIPLFGMKWNP